MKSPTQDDLKRLLFSDPASEAWEGDATAILTPFGEEGETPLECAQMVLDVVSSETGDVAQGMSLEGVVEADDLRDVATAAKRGAILLLHAAWAAEREAERLRGGS